MGTHSLTFAKLNCYLLFNCGLHCKVTDIRSKFCYTVQEEDQFPCKIRIFTYIWPYDCSSVYYRERIRNVCAMLLCFKMNMDNL